MAGKASRRGGVIAGMEPNTPHAVRRSLCATSTAARVGIGQAVHRPHQAAHAGGHAGPVAGLIARYCCSPCWRGPSASAAAGWVVGIACATIMNAALAHGLARYRADRLASADWVTLARATLAVGVAALVADSFGQPVPVTLLVSLAALALALDAVDGWVARRTRTTARWARSSTARSTPS